MTTSPIADFISHLDSLDVQILVEGERNASLEQIRLRCNAPEGTLTPALRQELAERKSELILYLQQQSKSIQSSSAIQSTIQDGIFPLSFAQQRLWFLYQLAPDNPFYNVPTAIRLTGKLNQKALEHSFHEIVRRHAALRTTFTTLDRQPVQVVEPEVKVELSVVNLPAAAVESSAAATFHERNLSPERLRDRITQQLATAEAQRPFNLTSDPLLRVTLLQFAPTEAVMLLTLHHIVADGWSLGVLVRELAAFYTAFVEEKTPELPPLPIQYTDFACWQRNWLQGEVLEEQLAYWRKQLHDLPILHLPSDRPRPAVQTYRGATYPVQLSPTLTQALESLSQGAGASLFMTLLAAFQTLLYRYTGQEDIAVGSPIANRHRSELEGLIGFFVNSLVMRSQLSGDLTFRELLAQVRNVALEAYAHQDLPFEKLVDELDPERDLGRNPLFQVAFALQNAPMQSLELPGLTLKPCPLESGSTRFDLEVHLWEPTHGLRSLWQSQEGLSGFISYSTDLFDRDRIARLVGHFQTLLEGIVANPNARLSDLPLLTAAEQQRILVDWNPSASKPAARCFHHIFEAQVEQAPDAIALVSEQGALTYNDLDQQADSLAQTLVKMGVQQDSLVGLCVDRSADMVIGILGILKAGGAYVPLDPNLPSDRLQFMVADTQVAIVLTQSWLVEKLVRSHVQVLCLDELSPSSYDIPPIKAEERAASNPDSLAYAIYTSGSTGTPKGVLLSHRGLCNVVEAQRQIFQPSCGSRVLQFSSLSFDASIFEVALALGSGATLYIPPKTAQLPGMALVQFLEDHAITHALLTPAVLAVLPSAELSALRVLITGGEACSQQVVDRWAANRRFFNAYGPTEITIWATIAGLAPEDNPAIIGQPIPNTSAYILDANLNLLPVGVPGELYIGGAGLARGYLNRPELTAEKFIPNPFDQKKSPSSLLYKTGDRVQYCSDGTIEFLGRVDNQIKLRGFRVELGEIEATLQCHPAIQDAVVITSGASDETRLVTYFSLNSDHFQRILLQSLQAQHVQYWQTLYNQTYQSSQSLVGVNPAGNSVAEAGDPMINAASTVELISNRQTFDTTGWNSSYTGAPISLEEMQEWVCDRTQQILAFKPDRVLEIGCGTGLLLFQIAPHCQKYVGTDFSAVSLQSVQHQLQALNLSQVDLLHQMATDFEGIQDTFDAVILNSIVQYFPSVDYLLQVLEGALQTVAPGGILFVGDVRSLPLLNVFHTWVQFSQADASLERTQLQQQVMRSQFEEPELAIDPAFFYAIQNKFPQIQEVQVRLSRGRSQNEMTQFRYNVLLRVKQAQTRGPKSSESQAVELPKPHNWKLKPITVDAVKTYLVEAEPEVFAIANVTNGRLKAAIKTADWLRKGEVPKTVGRMRDVLQDAVDLAIDPQDWWDLETLLPYTIEITWSAQANMGDYDVLFIRHGVELKINESRPQPSNQPWHHYTNNPLQSQFARQLIPDLRQHLKQSLPDYMVPSAFVPLEALPITTNGKVDRRALPPLTEAFIHSPSPTITSLTPTELTLVDIWKELLRLKQVNIHDNFFELGGHSLLATQMTSRVRDAFGLEMPLKNVFEAPTIAQLAPILETLRDTSSTDKVPPLVRLDRSAYRRKRSTLPSGSAQTLQEQPLQNQTLQAAQVPTFPIGWVLPSNQSFAQAQSPLVPLTLGTGSKPPFFCVHPMFGVVFPYLELAHHLGSDRSFYGLQPLGLDGSAPPLNQIEAIATYYIQAIKTVQPQGPYFLGGWSFGGLVALEMAQQLTQSGHRVGLLAILDTPAPCHKPSLVQSLKFLLGTALWSTLPFLLDYGAISTHRLKTWKPWFSRWQWSAILRLIPEESRLQLLNESAIAPMLRIVYANSQAAYRYVPRPYSDRIALFRAVEQPESLAQDATLGWSALASQIQVHEVPGNHLSLLKQPHVETLAQHLGRYLA
ncbi:MAG TPA: amino acid adenylation domain-containing protein [Leptolyngbyaceae cyanobacterium]